MDQPVGSSQPRSVEYLVNHISSPTGRHVKAAFLTWLTLVTMGNTSAAIFGSSLLLYTRSSQRSQTIRRATKEVRFRLYILFSLYFDLA